jgi:hypothetical protein
MNSGVPKNLSFREKSKNEYFLIFTRNPLLPQTPLESGIFSDFYPESIVFKVRQEIFDLLSIFYE